MDLTTLVIIAAIIAGAYMAWNIGANDVANAMGTSVGSKALTLVAAIVIAAVFEFCGAFFVGARVSTTIAKGIIDFNVAASQPWLLGIGMVCALLAAAIWLNFATYMGWPNSTTHSIVGAVTGLGIILGGFGAIEWGKIGTIALSWVASPICGALIAIGVYVFIVLPIYRTDKPTKMVRRIVPACTAMVFFLLALSMVYKGLKNLSLDLTLGYALVIAASAAAIAYGVAHILMQRRDITESKSATTRSRQIEPIFAVLQVITAAYMAFAHGANDVANAIGPMAAVVEVIKSGQVSEKVPVPLWLLALGGVGIVLGLSTYGYRVMATVGEKITSITPSRGFSAEFGCATTVLVCSKMGLPISTTHTLVGAVVGVGLARGLRALDLKVLKGVALSWLYTIPATAGVTVLLFLVLRHFLPMP